MNATVIRPPWPDELPRIQAAFRGLRPASGMEALVLATTGIPSRIVAAAGLLPPSAPGYAAALTCAARPRFIEQTDALALLEAVAVRAAELGAREIITLDDLRETDPRGPWLRRAGFESIHADELWKIDVATMRERLGRIHAKLEAHGRLAGFDAGPLVQEHIPEVQALMEATGLFSAGRVRIASDRFGGFDPEVSTVVLREGHVVAALLAKRENANAIVEARAVDPRYAGGLNIPNHLCFHRSVETGYGQGLHTLLFTANPDKDRETVRMAGKFGGTCESRTWHYRKIVNAASHA